MTDKKKQVRRTQAEIVADLEAKAKAARDKLNEKARKGYDATYARYLKALDQIVAGVNTANVLSNELDATASALGLSEEESSQHGLMTSVDGATWVDLLNQDVAVFDGEGNKVEDQG